MLATVAVGRVHCLVELFVFFGENLLVWYILWLRVAGAQWRRLAGWFRLGAARRN
jgi:hypothetical protein